jgi:hypothetical protein
LAEAQPGTLPQHLLYVLLAGLVASRFGLWLFDLVVTQLQQELVLKTELGEALTGQLLCEGALVELAGVVLAYQKHGLSLSWNSAEQKCLPSEV